MIFDDETLSFHRLKFTIEMKLGVYARPFVFQVDTGSRNMWVLCKAPGKHIQHKVSNF